jgi:uracil-DNA glycosylase
MVAIPYRKTGRRLPTRARPIPRPVRVKWAQLSREIRTCQRCPLGQTRTHAVVYRGSLRPRVVFVGEAPGVLEDRTGIPFVGRSGRQLDAAIERLGLGSSEFGVLNVLKCHPPGNRFDRSAARTCRPYLDRQLALLRPEVVVTLGASALRAIDPGAPAVLTAAGRPRTSVPWSVFPLLHPAAALRSRRWAKRWEDDLGALGAWLAARRA